GVGIELAVFVGQRVAELTPVVLTLIGHAQLLETEDDLLHVSRGVSAEQSDHVESSLLPRRRNASGAPPKRWVQTPRAGVSARAACRRWRPSRSWCQSRRAPPPWCVRAPRPWSAPRTPCCSGRSCGHRRDRW